MDRSALVVIGISFFIGIYSANSLVSYTQMRYTDKEGVVCGCVRSDSPTNTVACVESSETVEYIVSACN